MKTSIGGFPDFPLQPLERWLHDVLDDFLRLQAIEKFSIGQSNPTYRLRTNAGEFVLRKQPPGNLLPSAHAVDREFRVMRALRDTGVPVPEMIALCEDVEVIGTKFFLMQYLAGRVFTNPALPQLSPGQRGELYLAQADVAAKLASVDVAAIGLQDFGASGGYVDRQITRWSRQYRASETENIDAMEQLMQWLPQHRPGNEPRAGLVHGDFRLDNLIFHARRPEVIAVVDWELSTLGHPMVDFSYWMTMLRFPRGGYFEGIAAERRQHLGIPAEEDLLRRFLEASLLPSPENWNFWLAFHCFRFCAIVQGVLKRSLEGNASAPDAARVGAMARPVAELGWRIACS